MVRTKNKNNEAPTADFDVHKQKKAVSKYVSTSQASAYTALGIVVGVAAVLLALHGPTQLQDRVLQEIFDSSDGTDAVRNTVVPSEVHEGAQHAQDVVQKPEAAVKVTENVSSDEVWKNLINWLTSNGGEFPNIEIVSYPGMDDRGMQAKVDINEGEMVIKIPHDCIIFTETVQHSEIGQRMMKFPEFADEIQEQTLMGLFLLEERSKGKDSFWRPYIQSLPTDFDNVPVNFNKEELALMEGSYALKMYESEAADVDDSYALLCKYASDLCDKYSRSDFVWGRLAVMTRVFSVVVNDQETSALQPLADMINHSNEPDTTWDYVDDLRSGTMRTEKSVKKGSPFSISYGDKGNLRLLAYYGFALEDNVYDEAVVYIGLNDNDPLTKEKLERAHNPDASRYRLLYKLNADPSNEGFEDAMRFARLVVAKEADLEHLPVGGDHGPFSTQNERDALLLLQAVAEEELSEMPKSADEDRELLKNSQLSNNHRNIILTRLGEKNVLTKLITFADEIITLLDVTSFNEFRKLRLQKKYAPYRDYLRQIAEILRQQQTN